MCGAVLPATCIVGYQQMKEWQCHRLVCNPSTCQYILLGQGRPNVQSSIGKIDIEETTTDTAAVHTACTIYNKGGYNNEVIKLGFVYTLKNIILCKKTISTRLL